MKLSEIAIDVDRSEQGDWVEEIPGLPGVRLKTRGIENLDFVRRRDKMLASLPRQKLIGGRVDPIERDRIVGLALAETTLLDWDGIEGDDGEPQPFDKALAKKLLTEPEFKAFYNGAIYAADAVAQKRAVEIEDDGKNSPTP